MLLDEVIARLMAIRATHGGSLNVMTADHEGDKYAANFCDVQVAEEGEYPKDWDMPKGFTFVCISS